MSESLLTAVTPADVLNLLQDLGCRAAEVRQDNAVVVQSALQGVGFNILFGNRVPQGDGEAFVDLSLRCLLTVQGPFPQDLMERWNRDRRFARLSRQGDSLVLTLDVLLAGGVSPAWLRGQIELWDLVLRDYLRFLQTPAAEAA